MGAIKIDLDGILEQARKSFKNKETGLGLQMIKGSGIYLPSEPNDYVYWPDSAFHLMTGVPGCPMGRIVQIAGRPDSGKSSHAMQFMKMAQDQGHIVILWDPEEKFSKNRYDKHFKGNSEELLVVTSKVILEGGDMIRSLVRAIMAKYKDKRVFVVWDSVGGTISKSENEKDFRESMQLAEAAKDNAKLCRGFVSLMEEFKEMGTGKHRIAMLFINQTYANIGAPGQKESGGQRIEFHSSLILQLTRKADLFKVKDKIKRKIGISTRARVKKNHLMDSEDTLAEMILDITAGGIVVNAKDPAFKLVSEEMKSADKETFNEEDS